MNIAPENVGLAMFVLAITVGHFWLRSSRPTIGLVYRKLLTPLKISSTSTGWIGLQGRGVQISYTAAANPEDPEIISVHLSSRSKPMVFTFIKNMIVNIKVGEELRYGPGLGSLSQLDHFRIQDIQSSVHNGLRSTPAVRGQKPAA